MNTPPYAAPEGQVWMRNVCGDARDVEGQGHIPPGGFALFPREQAEGMQAGDGHIPFRIYRGAAPPPPPPPAEEVSDAGTGVLADDPPGAADDGPGDRETLRPGRARRG